MRRADFAARRRAPGSASRSRRDLPTTPRPRDTRRGIIEANPDLQERELGKRLALTDGIAEALRQRGLDAETALLTARISVLVQQTAMLRWTTELEDSRPSRELLTDALLFLEAIVNQMAD